MSFNLRPSLLIMWSFIAASSLFSIPNSTLQKQYEQLQATPFFSSEQSTQHFPNSYTKLIHIFEHETLSGVGIGNALADAIIRTEDTEEKKIKLWRWFITLAMLIEIKSHYKNPMQLYSGIYTDITKKLFFIPLFAVAGVALAKIMKDKQMGTLRSAISGATVGTLFVLGQAFFNLFSKKKNSHMLDLSQESIRYMLITYDQHLPVGLRNELTILIAQLEEQADRKARHTILLTFYQQLIAKLGLA